MTDVFLPEHELQQLVFKAFLNQEVPEDEAEIISSSIVQAEAQGLKTHGLLRVPLYIEKMKNGGIKTPTKVDVVQEEGVVTILDANHGWGQVVAKSAMERAVDNAQKYGVGVCSVRNSSHFGTAGYYSTMAAKSDMIGFSCSNASARLPAWGGKDKLLGNNPWSVAMPTHNPDAPFLLDMANSVTAAGKLRVAAAKNEEIPLGWALDKNGEMTTDPRAGLEGVLLPMAQHKGYGITLAVSILSSVLSDSVWDSEVHSLDEVSKYQNTGNFFLALNISHWMPIEKFKSKMEGIIAKIHNTGLAKGYSKVYYPGEIEGIKVREGKEKGVAVDKKTLDKLLIYVG